MSGFEEVAAIVSIVGTAASAYAAHAQGDAQADVLRQNASIAAAEGEAASLQTGRRGEQTLGTVIANAGAAGIDPNTGSPASVRGQVAGQVALAQQTDLYNARLKAMGLNYEAGAATAAGDDKAIGTLLSGAGQAYKDFGTPGSNPASQPADFTGSSYGGTDGKTFKFTGF